MKKVLVLALSLVLLGAFSATAAESKIGFVDLQKALNLSAEGKAAKEKISAKVKDYEADIDKRQQDLKVLKEDLEKQSVLLSPEARDAKERDYQQKLKEFQRFTKDVQDELQQQDSDHTNRIIEKLVKVVQEMGKREGYDLIIERNSGGVIYGADKADLTATVLKEFDARYQKTKGK
jgi:outer membrane protein